MKALGLFSGIGGFELGLSHAGFDIHGMVELDPWACSILRKNFPGVPVYQQDIRTFSTVPSDQIDLVCGGFPCQDISLAGKGAGINGERSGLWSEMLRVMSETRPQWILIENVGALRGRGLVSVLQDLRSIGYDARWDVISAASIGAPHIRDRVWILGWRTNTDPEYVASSSRVLGSRDLEDEEAANVANASSHRRVARGKGDAQEGKARRQPDRGGLGQDVPDSRSERLAFGESLGRNIRTQLEALVRAHREGDGWWSVEPDVGRVVNGVPKRVDRIRGLGNAVVPLIPYAYGRVIR